MAPCHRLQSKYQHFPRGRRTKLFSSPGPLLHPKSFSGTCNLPLPPPKVISTNNDNVIANHSPKRHHQIPSPHDLTPFTQRLSIPNNQPATSSVTSLADSPFSQIVEPTTYSCSMTTTATLSSSNLYTIEVHTKSNESSPPSTPTWSHVAYTHAFTPLTTKPPPA